MTEAIRTHAKKGAYTTIVRQNRHALIADEPTELGGTDMGMNPYGLLASALGACTSMTLQMYATRKEWDLQEIRVTVEHSKEYFNDCENCENKGQKLDFFKRTIVVTGNLTDEQKQRLLDIADKCPVHKTLHSGIKVETTIN